MALRAALGADRGGLHALRLCAPSVSGGAPEVDRIGIDAGVAAFAVVLSMLTGVIRGLAPARRVAVTSGFVMCDL
jgi:hypothetical protein